MVDPASPDTPRDEIQKRLDAARANRVAPNPAPRYDEVFYEGTAALDRLAGEPVVAASVVSPPDPLDLDAIMTRVYPTVSAMRWDFEKLITEVERLRAALARPALPQEDASLYPTLFTSHPDGIYRPISLDQVRGWFTSSSWAPELNPPASAPVPSVPNGGELGTFAPPQE